MTSAELAELAVDLVRQVATARSERNAYRDVAGAAIHSLHDVMRERDRLKRRVTELLKQTRSVAA